jgi:hypothetical protein
LSVKDYELCRIHGNWDRSVSLLLSSVLHCNISVTLSLPN